MKVRVLYFAHLRRAIGTAGEELVLPEGATVAAAVDLLSARHNAVAASAGSLLATVNEAWTPREAPLAEGDTLGLMPPVSGG